VSGACDEFALLRDNAAEAGVAWKEAPHVRRVAVDLPDGRRLSALRWGSGAPEVVLLHGGSQNAHTWDTVALVLDRPLLAVDLPGHGLSDWRADHDYLIADGAEDVAVAMSQLAPAARLVVGMSLGGLIALALAAAHPDLVPRLLLVDVTPGVNPEKVKAINDFVRGPESFAGFDEILERTVRHNPGRTEASLRRGVMHNAVAGPDGRWHWRWDPAGTSAGTLAAGAAGDHGQGGFDALWDAIEALGVPLVLARGSRSAVVDDDDVAELRRRKPDAGVVVVDGAGHSVQGDRPGDLAAVIAAVLGDEK
jgi:pimeloyl-ACP methyl ester carboxylesterase